MEFSVKMEIVALLILIILFIYHRDRQNSSNTRYRMFSASLIFTTATVLFLYHVRALG